VEINCISVVNLNSPSWAAPTAAACLDYSHFVGRVDSTATGGGAETDTK
jgi:hypothetical protein